MKHLSLLFLSLSLLACSAEPPAGESASELVFRRATQTADAGPPQGHYASIGDLVSPPPPPGGCWWEPDPTRECVDDIPIGREPPCPTCVCNGCSRSDWLFGIQLAKIQAGTSFAGMTLADHAVLSPYPSIGSAKADYVLIDIQPSKVADGYQPVVVPAQYAQKTKLYIYFLTESGDESIISEAALIPKL